MYKNFCCALKSKILKTCKREKKALDCFLKGNHDCHPLPMSRQEDKEKGICYNYNHFHPRGVKGDNLGIPSSFVWYPFYVKTTTNLEALLT
jgi:hypothetical protein